MHPIQGLIIDLDGTVFRWDELIEGAHDLVNGRGAGAYILELSIT